MKRYWLVFICILVIASTALAQTKISGSLDCAKADPRHVIPIPDREGFAYAIAQYKCTWTKDFAIEGLQSKDYVNTVFSEVMGPTNVRITAIGHTRYVSGEGVYSRSVGTRDQKALTSSGKWTYIFATGKLRGIKGGGTYTCKMKSAEPDAGYTCESEGEYTLPPAKK